MGVCIAARGAKGVICSGLGLGSRFSRSVATARLACSLDNGHGTRRRRRLQSEDQLLWQPLWAKGTRATSLTRSFSFSISRTTTSAKLHKRLQLSASNCRGFLSMTHLQGARVGGQARSVYQQQTGP